MGRLLDENDVYALFDINGFARLHVADIDVLPRVDAKKIVRGRWDDGDCSACGFDIRDLIDGESNFRNWVWEGLPYCPNCGAKMDEKEEYTDD